MPFIQIFYVSRCGLGLTSTDVRRIVGSSQIHNRRLNITGVLAYSGKHFAQVLEGHAAPLGGLMDRIALDSRHRDVRLLMRREGEAHRLFGEWSLHLLDSPTIGDGLEQLLGDDSHDEARRQALSLNLLDRITEESRWHAVGDLGFA